MTKTVSIDKAALTDIIKEISTYDNPEFNFSVAIYADGSVERGDININDQSWTQFYKTPVITITVRPWYTMEDIRNDGNDPEDHGMVDSYKDTAEHGIKAYVNEVADIISEANGDYAKAQNAIRYEMDSPYGNMPW